MFLLRTKNIELMVFYFIKMIAILRLISPIISDGG